MPMKLDVFEFTRTQPNNISLITNLSFDNAACHLTTNEAKSTGGAFVDTRSTDDFGSLCIEIKSRSYKDLQIDDPRIACP